MIKKLNDKILARYKDQTYTKKDLEFTEKLTGNKFSEYITYLGVQPGFEIEINFIHRIYRTVLDLCFDFSFNHISRTITLECYIGKMYPSSHESYYKEVLLDFSEYLW